MEGICQGRRSPRQGPHPDSVGAAFQHHVHSLARPQLRLQRPQLKHWAARPGAPGSIFALALCSATQGRATRALLSHAETLGEPVDLMDAPSFVCQLELVTAGTEATREAEVENGMGAAICLWSLSCSFTLMAFPDCTLCKKISAQKAAQAQSFSPATSSSFSFSVAFQGL